jgi:hypothetical protein
VVLTAVHSNCKNLDLFVILTDGQSIKDYLCIFVILTDGQSIKDYLCIFQEAECEKSAMDIKYNTDTKIEDNARMYKLQKANPKSCFKGMKVAFPHIFVWNCTLIMLVYILLIFYRISPFALMPEYNHYAI